MPTPPTFFRRLSASGANRIAFSAALRGTAVAAVPFLWLRAAGLPVAALFATIAVLNLSIADAGGPYRQRLVIMLALAFIVPLVLIAGMQARNIWWLAVALMFLVALLGGLARLFGTAGTAIGLISSVVFLIGIEIPADFIHSLQYAGFYLAGALWTLLVSLVIWRLRPYQRVRYELGEGFRQLATLIGLLRARCADSDCEAELAAVHQQTRTTLEQAEQTLGDTLGDAESVPPFVSDLIVLLRAGSRINAAAASLGGALGHRDMQRLPQSARRELRDLLSGFEAACQATAAGLLDETGRYDLSAVHEGLRQWRQSTPPASDIAALGEVETFLSVITRQLESAQRVVDRLGGRPRGQGLLPPLHGPAFPTVSRASLRANLTFRSLVFRHAMRVAVAAALGTAAYLLWAIPHGVWIPLTVLIVLQPHLGATLNKALHRTGGTLLGALVAGVLVILLHDTAGIDGAILACFFLTLLFFRRRYWIAVAFLTPLIIMLLSLLVGHPWIEIIERIGNTLAGAAVALVAGYLLWPSWEYRRLPDQLADAIAANRRYLTALLAATVHGLQPDWPLAGLRSQVELATSNARAALDRMLTEPRWFRREARKAFTTVTHIERLGRHITRLSIYLHETANTVPSFGDSGTLFEERLRDLEDAIRHNRAARSDHDLERVYQQLRKTWQTEAGNPSDQGAVDSLVSSIIGDINSLQAVLAGETR